MAGNWARTNPGYGVNRLLYQMFELNHAAVAPLRAAAHWVWRPRPVVLPKF